MNRAMRGVTLGAVALALIVWAGCENNEANVKGKGVTPPGAAETSEAGATVKAPPKTAPPKGYGGTGYGGAMKRK
jgi:hypothetical protein